MSINILNRYTKAAIYSSADATTIREACEMAVRAGANLRGANLCAADLCGADLRGANLRGANLCAADLCGADLRGANLGGADLGGADLGDADLGGANLGGADLGGADLGDANLRAANLCGAKIIEGEIASVLASGILLGYKWIAFRMSDERVLLQYGCETLWLTDWPEQIPTLCEKHQSSSEVEEYVRALNALVAYVTALTKKEQEETK